FAGKTSQKHYALTGSLGGVWKMTPQWHLVGNLSRGFHAPSAQSMVLTSVAGTVKTLPNPELKPETNITAELGLRWYGDQHQISLTGWQSDYDNLISLVPINNSGLNQRQNVAKATLRGL
ncbi:TonB-dependent receptor, partial [Salmonella enterica]|nr:TonB-dependent receptor [Salmonella enterica]